MALSLLKTPSALNLWALAELGRTRTTLCSRKSETKRLIHELDEIFTEDRYEMVLSLTR